MRADRACGPQLHRLPQHRPARRACTPSRPVCTPTCLVGVVQWLAGHHGRAATVHLQRAHGGHNDHAVGAQAAAEWERWAGRRWVGLQGCWKAGGRMRAWEGGVQGHGTKREREDGPAPVAALDVAELKWEGEGAGAGREGWAEAESTRRCAHSCVACHAIHVGTCNDASRKLSSQAVHSPRAEPPLTFSAPMSAPKPASVTT